MTEPKRPVLSIRRKPANPQPAEPRPGAATPADPQPGPAPLPASEKVSPVPAVKPEETEIRRKEKMAARLAKKIRRGEAVIPLLAKRWPLAFSPDDPKPLKVGIREDILREISAGNISLSKKQVTSALWVYTQRPAYRAAVARGGSRVDLRGAASGEVTEKDAAHATRKLRLLRQRDTDDDTGSGPA